MSWVQANVMLGRGPEDGPDQSAEKKRRNFPMMHSYAATLDQWPSLRMTPPGWGGEAGGPCTDLQQQWEAPAGLMELRFQTLS